MYIKEQCSSLSRHNLQMHFFKDPNGLKMASDYALEFGSTLIDWD